jgi:molybdopterin converting factor small subunit
MRSIRVCVQLFGAFRKYSSGSALRFEVPPGTTVSALRAHLGEALRSLCPAFPDQALLDVSVLADEDRILDDGQSLGPGLDEVSLAVLPPVCGG